MVGVLKLAAAAALSCCLLVLGACSEKTEQAKQPNGAPPPPAKAGFVTVKAEPVTLSANIAGRVVPYQMAEIRPQIGGIIEERVFKEGSEVKKGDILYRIDDDSYRAAVAAAEAALEKSNAALASAQARNDRYQVLGASAAVSKQEAEDARATFLQAKADVSVATANLQTARINLDHATIKAPIDGQIGTSSVTPGSLVTAGQTQALATIRQIDPVYVDLTESSGNLIKFRSQIREGKITPLVGEGQSPEVHLTFADGTAYPDKGKLETAEQFVDQTTSSFVIRTLFENKDRGLLPGMYVRATISLASSDKGFLIPQRAVTRNNKGEATARFIKADGSVESRVLDVTTDIGSRWLVTKGITEGDKLIVDGVQSVQDGQKVTPVEVRLDDNGIVQPMNTASAEAKPADVAANEKAK